MKPRRRKRPAARRHKPRVETIEIQSIAAGGEGVGRLGDGRAVFVHRTAPSEAVEVAVVEEKPRWARGRLLRVLRPSPERREAPCPHYVDCGGCTLEHLDYPAQLRAKARIVADALARIGGIELAGPPEVIASPLEFRYRNRVSFALRRLRGGSVVAGFHALDEPGRITGIDGRCLLPEEPLATAWDQLREAWGPGADRLPAGASLRLTLRGSAQGRVSLLIEGGQGTGRPAELLDAVSGLDAIWHRDGSSIPEHLAGAPGIPETWGDETFELGGTAFLQVNRAAAELLEAYVLSLAGDMAGRTVVDAYCGIGLHGRRLARAGAHVDGIEMDPHAVRVANAATVPGLSVHEGAVETLLPRFLPADLLILNPPRAGVAAEVVEAIAARPPEKVIYVSCDPATLARDLKRLVSRFRLDTVRCFDLFPQTSHVETVASLSRVGGAET